MNRRLALGLGAVALASIAATWCPRTGCAGPLGGGTRGQSLDALTSPTMNSTRLAYLSPSSGQYAGADLLEFQRNPTGRHGSSLETLAYKVSFVGGLILTADQVVRSVDSVMEAATYRRADGSYLRLNAEPMSRGFLVGVVVSRPLDF